MIARKALLPGTAASIVLSLTLGCSSVSRDSAGRAQPPDGATPAPTSSFATDVNRNLAAAAAVEDSGRGSADYRIGPEDLLEITVFNIPENDGKMTPRTTTVRVDHQGSISLPVLGKIGAKGLTVSELESRLRERFDKYIYNPQIGVLVKEFRQRVSVFGAVQKPGVVELTGPKSVIEMLAMAGGVTEKAGKQVHIYRQGEKGRETHVIDLAVLANSTGLINANNAAMINMPVEPGDMISVPESGMFFVDGAVRKPGSYPLGRSYTLTQALATAGGIDHELNSSDVAIFRRAGPGKINTITVDLNDIRAGRVADPEIQPDDVVVLSVSTTKYILKRFVGTLIGGMSIGAFMQ